MAITLEHYQSVRQHFITLLGGKCAVCGTVESLELDHIVSNGWYVGRGRGRDIRMWEWFESQAEGNLQILCSKHNQEKR